MPQKKVNIIYSRPFKDFGTLDHDLSRMIESISPRIQFWDVSELAQSERKGDFSAQLKLDEILAEAEIFFGFPPPPNLISRAPKLKWIQDILAGVEMFMTPDILASPVILTNARGIHPQVVESAMMMALMLTKNMPTFNRYQQEKIWHRDIPGMLYSKTMGILGLGQIGSKIARAAKAFHMKVIAIDINEMKKSGDIDIFLKPGELPVLLSQSDIVVVALPITRETNKLIGEKELKMMKPSAYLINISRGRIIDEEALVRALKEKWIAGAGLDVFASEPLPAASPLWELPEVILTPHVAGLSQNYDKTATGLFCKNLRRYLAGKELLNVVDKVKGY